MQGLGESILADVLPAGQLGVLLRFHPPDLRHRDLDNLIAACKGAVDGVFQGLQRDDRDVRLLAGAWGPVQPGGAVWMGAWAL